MPTVTIEQAQKNYCKVSMSIYEVIFLDLYQHEQGQDAYCNNYKEYLVYHTSRLCLWPNLIQALMLSVYKKREKKYLVNSCKSHHSIGSYAVYIGFLNLFLVLI